MRFHLQLQFRIFPCRYVNGYFLPKSSPVLKGDPLLEIQVLALFCFIVLFTIAYHRLCFCLAFSFWEILTGAWKE